MRVMSIRSPLTGYRTSLMLIDDSLTLAMSAEQCQNVLAQLITRVGDKGAMMRVNVDSLVTLNA